MRVNLADNETSLVIYNFSHAFTIFYRIITSSSNFPFIIHTHNILFISVQIHSIVHQATVRITHSKTKFLNQFCWQLATQQQYTTQHATKQNQLFYKLHEIFPFFAFFPEFHCYRVSSSLCLFVCTCVNLDLQFHFRWNFVVLLDFFFFCCCSLVVKRWWMCQTKPNHRKTKQRGGE